ncbi:MAG: PSD1 and planctomycete cytochrome C domain-containing protein [Mariniblastus sp.]|nr:PSD1 and planctomycete cytochrome C domain-containing protein [Mariniblastus sp.]
MTRFGIILALSSLLFFEKAPAQTSPFEAQVAPIFSSRCLACHNDALKEGDFSLQTRASILESGHLVPGNAANSYLLDTITGDDTHRAEMPKIGPQLKPNEVKAIHDWIQQGAKWPEKVTLQHPPATTNFDWWSLRPLAQTKPPRLEDPSARAWIKTPLDAFVLKRLRDDGLEPSPSATRATLIRRLTYDLTGLPPTPDEIHRFVTDTRSDAYLRLVNRLLASPRYGEHWARHWLDVVKYADTCGYDKDKLRPNAWPYRDYVIRSFNEDKPYPRFLKEQLAGDVLFPGSPDGILGMGFIAAGPWDFIGHVEVPETKIDGKVARNLDRDDMVSNTLNSFCSVTIQCARCHDHKFDPITQEHYYGLQAVFSAVDRADRVYALDPLADKKRRQLTKQIDRLIQTQRELQQRLHTQAGAELKELDTAIANSKTPTTNLEFGYHSKISSDPSDVKWVQATLKAPQKIKTVILNPCHDDFAGIGSGFGFPVRFRVEVDGRIVADRTQQDTTNPGLQPVAIKVNQVGKVVRIVATRLAERKNDYIFALAELQILGTEGDNLALGSTVDANDSTEMGPRWRKINLVDGLWKKDATESLEALQQRRRALLNDRVPSETLARHFQTEEQLSRLRTERDQLPAGKKVYAAATDFPVEGNFKPTQGQTRPVSVLHRGNIQTPGKRSRPGTLPLSADDSFEFEISGQDEIPEGQRRAMLANWISSNENPLTWRSIVNRVWHYHFGRGIVDTPNDFGRMGSEPTHPELLDWLAETFRDRGGSLKDLHRLIVLSSTYRQSSDDRAGCLEVDSGNRLLWKVDRRRLSAEEIRDSILSVSGRLNLEMGGPGFYLFSLEKTEHSPHYEYHKFDHDDPNSFRRAIYRFVVRSQPDPYMTTLDCADSSQSTPARVATQTPLQALAMMNNGFNIVMAENFAERMRSHSAELPAQVKSGATLAFGRSPTDAELKPLIDYAHQHGLDNLARVLFNTSEFLFVD